MRGLFATAAALGTICLEAARAGPYAPAAGQPGSTAVYRDDPSIVAWASAVGELVRGPQAIFDSDYGNASFGQASNALCKADVTVSGGQQNTFSIVSLGDGGWITLLFAQPIRNGPGADFAVFENSFSDTFLELGLVEVSSDGEHFFRFPSVSLTPTAGLHDDLEHDDFSEIDPTNIHNLAGKYRGEYGTPFDLSDLSGVAEIDLDHIVAIKIIDVVGSVDSRWASHDSLGNIIKDPFPTVFPTGGFDLDAVAVLKAVPEPSALVLLLLGLGLCATHRRR